MVQSGHKDSVAQRSVSSTTYQNFSQIGIQLHEMVGAPTFRLSEKRDGTEIQPEMPIIHGISAFQLHRIYQETLLQYSPNIWVPAPCSDMSRCRNTALIFDHPEFFCCCHQHHLLLQSEHLGMWNLDHSFTLNLLVNSI